MTRRTLGLLLLAVACKEAPISGSPDAGQSSLAGKWQGVQSVDPNGQGNLARLELEGAPGGQVRGALDVSYGMDANDLATIGFLSGPAQGGTFIRATSFLADGGLEPRLTMTVTASQSLNHIDWVEQQQTLDGGPLPVYYRLDRQ
jgi:hypothetical protein